MSEAVVASLTIEDAQALALCVSDQELVHLLDQAIGLVLGHKNSPDQGLYYGLASVFRGELRHREHWW